MTTKTIPVSLPREVPLITQAQVLVVGGGPGGIGAAVAAARGGADTLLVEHYGFLGGMATAGEVNPFMPNHIDRQSLDTGIFEEWVERMAHYGGVRGDHTRTFDPNVARLAAEDLCLDAGVRLLYHHRAAHVESSDRRIRAVVLHSKSGLGAVRASQYIDSTGDGDVAALAGCAFHFGSEQTGGAQPMTLCFKLKLDRASAPDGKRDRDLYLLMRESMDDIQAAYRKAQEDGRIECPRENVLVFRGVDDDVVHFNTTRVIRKSSIKGDELSAAEVEARRQLRQIIDVLRSEVPIFKNARIYSIAPQIGIRESRRIIGRNYVTVEDYKAARRYPDAVARVRYGIDIHNPEGKGTTIIHLDPGVWYEIPWGSLLPRDTDNLAIGSRCISVDHAVHSSVRVMPPVCSLGQAAGTAAALAVKAGCDVSEVNGITLNTELRKAGRNLLEHDSDHAPTPVRSPEQQEKKLAAQSKAAGNFSA
ncbi:MAG: FAD-dependent oxidoreductase [Phycisphaera sp.]|nr:FAD-dependent oxidoreductase [Phycisphaera sp.]